MNPRQGYGILKLISLEDYLISEHYTGGRENIEPPVEGTLQILVTRRDLYLFL